MKLSHIESKLRVVMGKYDEEKKNDLLKKGVEKVETILQKSTYVKEWKTTENEVKYFSEDVSGWLQ